MTPNFSRALLVIGFCHCVQLLIAFPTNLLAHRAPALTAISCGIVYYRQFVSLVPIPPAITWLPRTLLKQALNYQPSCVAVGLLVSLRLRRPVRTCCSCCIFTSCSSSIVRISSISVSRLVSGPMGIERS